MDLSKRKVLIGLVSGGIVLLLALTDAFCDELWSRGFMGTPSSGPFRPFNVVILESVTGNHLRATCSFANYSDESESPPPVKIRGVTRDGKFYPHVFAKVTNEVNGEWKTIGELGVKGKLTSRWVAPKSVDDSLVVELDVFRPLIGTYFYGSVVLPTGESAVFELNDLLPPGQEVDKTGNGLTRSNAKDSTVRLATVSVDTRLGSRIDAFRSLWGPPSDEDSLVRTASLKWERPAINGESIVGDAYAVEVAFVDGIAYEIALRSRERITPSKLVELTRPFLTTVRDTDFVKPMSKGRKLRAYKLSDGTFVSANRRKRHTVVLIKGADYARNEEIFNDEAKVRLPKFRH